MKHPLEQKNYYDDEIDFLALLNTLWMGKWVIMACTMVFALAGVVYAYSKPNIYQADTLLAPVSDGGDRLVAGQLGGLASLAGINLGGSGAANAMLVAKETLQSRAFLSSFINRHGLAVPLKAAKAWDQELQRWVINRELYDPQTQAWVVGENSKSQEPSDWALVKTFKEKNFSIAEDKRSGMLTLSVKSLSPVAAKRWATNLVKDINEHIRTQDVAESEARIQYLEGKLSETSITGMQQVFYQLIENETRTVMLANAKSEYAFKTIDPAVVPQEKSAPNRALICIVASLLGSILGMVMVIFVSFFRP